MLMLLNPGIEGRIATTNSLFSGLQIVMPGESARAHRHTPSALRLIINSDGGYTTVNGDRIPMYPGDLILTPNWTWHDHGNESGEQSSGWTVWTSRWSACWRPSSTSPIPRTFSR